MLEPQDILFIGQGTSAVAYYRCVLPAMALGADWVGVAGEPPQPAVVTGLVKGGTNLPTFTDYKVVILQQVAGRKWLNLIRDLQGKGVKVIYECDDYLHGVGKARGHDFAKFYSKEFLKKIELCMRVCDGMIVSTPTLARKYAKFNRNIYVCENGVDLARYELTLPERATWNYGFAGATGHTEALLPWLQALAEHMNEHEDTTFVSIGQPGLATPFQQHFGPERAVGIPFTAIETYPAAMAMLDVALAPAGKGVWALCKSQLRFYEAGALGIPLIASPSLYTEIEHGVTGFHASSPEEVGALLDSLHDDRDYAREVGTNAQAYVQEHRDIKVIAERWLEVAGDVAARQASTMA